MSRYSTNLNRCGKLASKVVATRKEQGREQKGPTQTFGTKETEQKLKRGLGPRIIGVGNNSFGVGPLLRGWAFNSGLSFAFGFRVPRVL